MRNTCKCTKGLVTFHLDDKVSPINEEEVKKHPFMSPGWVGVVESCVSKDMVVVYGWGVYKSVPYCVYTNCLKIATKEEIRNADPCGHSPIIQWNLNKTILIGGL